MISTQNTSTETAARLCRLTDTRAPRSGRCCVEGCGEEGRYWHRASTAAGVRAVLGCATHEHVVERLLETLSMEDAVRLATPAQRRAALQRAAAMDERASVALRTSARLSGASSATHAYGLHAAYYAHVAQCERDFAAALA